MVIKVDVYCCKCWNGHQAEVDCAQLLPGQNHAETECPYCGESLDVLYEMRAHVVCVKPAATEYPQAWTMPPRAW